MHTVRSKVDFKRLMRLAGQLASRTPDDIVHTLPDHGACSPKSLPCSYAPAPPVTPVKITRRFTARNQKDALRPFLASVDRALVNLMQWGGHRRYACHEDMTGAASSHGDEDEPTSQLAYDNPFGALLGALEEEPEANWADATLSPHPSQAEPSEAGTYVAPSVLTAPSSLTDLTDSADGALSSRSQGPDRSWLQRSYSDVVAGRSQSPSSLPKRAIPAPMLSRQGASIPQLEQWRQGVVSGAAASDLSDEGEAKSPRLAQPGQLQRERQPEREGGGEWKRVEKKRKKPRHDADRASKRRQRGDERRKAGDHQSGRAAPPQGPWGRQHRDNFARSREFRVYAINADAEIEYAVARGGFRGNAKVDRRRSPSDMAQLDALEFWRYDWRDE